MTMTLFAHAGHGTTASNSLFHYLTEPTHLVGWLAGIAILFSVAWMTRRLSELRGERVATRR